MKFIALHAASLLYAALSALGIYLWSCSLDTGLRLGADCLLGWTLLVLAWFDIRHMILPDGLTLPLLLLGLALSIRLDQGAIIDHALGAILGYGVFALIGWSYRRWRKRDGLGGGDAKLLAAAGAWVGWEGLGNIILLAAVSALGYVIIKYALGQNMTAVTRIPFGPFLAFATWLTWLYGVEMLTMM